jgi:hypothetical protein
MESTPIEYRGMNGAPQGGIRVEHRGQIFMTDPRGMVHLILTDNELVLFNGISIHLSRGIGIIIQRTQNGIKKLVETADDIAL